MPHIETSESIRESVSESRNAWQPPDAIGLCPVHGEEFYMPITLPLNNPFVRCPMAGCEHLLILYTSASR